MEFKFPVYRSLIESDVVDGPEVGIFTVSLLYSLGTAIISFLIFFWWEATSITISATVSESKNKCYFEIYSMDQYACSYRGS